MKKLTYHYLVIKEISGNLHTKITVTPLLFDFQKYCLGLATVVQV